MKRIILAVAVALAATAALAADRKEVRFTRTVVGCPSFDELSDFYKLLADGDKRAAQIYGVRHRCHIFNDGDVGHALTVGKAYSVVRPQGDPDDYYVPSSALR
jgi:hypothetical protein